MSIAPNRRDLTNFISTMDGLDTGATKEEWAQALLEKAFELYEKAAKFTVVGQVRYSNGYLNPEEAAASKVALGCYRSAGPAKTHAESLISSRISHEDCRVWVLPIHQGSPMEWATERKKLRERLTEGPTNADRLVATLNQTTIARPRCSVCNQEIEDE